MKLNVLNTWGTIAGLALLTVSLNQPAKADIITTLSSITADPSGGYDFTYNVNLTNNEELMNPNPNVNPQFGTLYDVSSSALTLKNVTGFLATDFTFAWSLTNTPAYKTTPTDSSSLYNLRWTFTAPSTTIVGGLLPPPPGGTADVDLGNFTLLSPYNSWAYENFDGQAIKSFGAASGTITGNIGLDRVPTGVVPEPASMLLMGAGLFALGWVGRRQAKKRSKA